MSQKYSNFQNFRQPTEQSQIMYFVRYITLLLFRCKCGINYFIQTIISQKKMNNAVHLTNKTKLRFPVTHLLRVCWILQISFFNHRNTISYNVKLSKIILMGDINNKKSKFPIIS